MSHDVVNNVVDIFSAGVDQEDQVVAEEFGSPPLLPLHHILELVTFDACKEVCDRDLGVVVDDSLSLFFSPSNRSPLFYAFAAHTRNLVVCCLVVVSLHAFVLLTRSSM
eukprot:6197828-Amphidinium_carterae.1